MTLELLRSLLHLHQVQIVLGQVSKTNDQIIAETKKKTGNNISPVFSAVNVKFVRRLMKTKNSKTGIMVYTNSFSTSAKLEQMGQQPDKFQ